MAYRLFHIFAWMCFLLLNVVWTSEKPVSCMDAMARCRESRSCSTAIRGLDEKCQVSDGQCSAKMIDLPRCGQMMDDIFAFGFPATRCSCNKLQQCQTLLDKIYNNPCFVSIRHLRKQNLFPYDISEHKGEQTTHTPSNGQKVIATTRKPWDLGLRDGDEIEKPKTEEYQDRSSLPNDPRGQGPVGNTDLLDDEKPRKHKDERTQEDNTNYKLLTIVLGILLGMFILGAVVFFAWTSVRRSLFYTKGKEVSTPNKDEATSPSLAERGVSTHHKRSRP